MLGNKNYTKKLGGVPRKKTYDPFTKDILDEINHYSGEVVNPPIMGTSRQAETYVSTERAGPPFPHLSIPASNTIKGSVPKVPSD